MNESEYRTLIEASWQRPLSDDEQACLDAWLITHPEARNEWESESGLNRLLGQLPDAPVASNFTALVLQAVDRETRTSARSNSLFERIRHWLWRPVPRAAWALLLVGGLWFGYDQHQTNVRGQMAKGLSVMANVAALSDPVVLQDFEAIQRLSAREDEELFAVLTK